MDSWGNLILIAIGAYFLWSIVKPDDPDTKKPSNYRDDDDIWPGAGTGPGAGL